MPQIYGYALSGVGRSGAERSGYTSPRTFVAINGTQYATNRPIEANKVLDETLSVSEVLNQIPNTAAFTMKGAEPPEGADVIVTLGSINNLERLYAGTTINRGHGYIGSAANFQAFMNVVDYTWQLTRRRVSGVWTNTSPSVIAAAILAAVPGFTLWVSPGLPNIDVFSVTDVDALSALTALAKRVGGYCDVNYRKVVKLFITDTTVTQPTDLTAAHVSLTEFFYTRDLSQVRTRVFVEGGGVNALAPCAVGETIIPVATTAWYNAAGGKVKSGSQHIAYTGIQAAGGGSLAGPGAAPSSAPTLANRNGTGMSAGPYQYGVTFVVSGESLPSPLAAITTGVLAPPPNVSILAGGGGSGGVRQGYYRWGISFVTADGETPPANNGVAFITDFWSENLSNIPIGPTGVTQRKIFRTTAQATSAAAATAQLYFLFTLTDNTTTTWFDNNPDSMLGAAAPTSNTTIARQVDLSAIPLGGASVTSRKLYRTAVGGSQLKFLATIADNTTTIYTDSIADGSLGANAPTSDTSGLTQPSGQVNAGSTSALLAGAGAFQATGGWAIPSVGAPIRYTGVTGNTLTGIPASGPGSIAISLPYNTQIAAAPALIGIPASGAGSIVYPILQGDPVNLLIQVDDVAAQLALAALLATGSVASVSAANPAVVATAAPHGFVTGQTITLTDTTTTPAINGPQIVTVTDATHFSVPVNVTAGQAGAGGTVSPDDGVVEDYIQDGRLGETEARARGTAWLALKSKVLITIHYKVRDINTHAGRTVNVNLGPPTNMRTAVSAPTAAPSVAAVAGAGIDTGTHQWAVTFGSAAGESLPSPVAIASVGVPVTAPTYTPIHTIDHATADNPPGAFAIGDSVEYVFTYSAAATALDFTQESGPSPSSGASTVAVSAGGAPYPDLQLLQVQYTTDPTVKWIHRWRRVNGGTYRLVDSGGIGARANNFTTGTITESDPNYAFGVYLTAIPTPTGGNQASISSVPIGPTGTTSRKIYRTVAAGSQLKLQQTIPNNTATVGVTDATPDASLGANAPTSDTANLATPIPFLIQTVQINAFAPALFPTYTVTAGSDRFSLEDLLRLQRAA